MPDVHPALPHAFGLHSPGASARSLRRLRAVRVCAVAAPEKQRMTYEKSFMLPGSHTVQVSPIQLPLLQSTIMQALRRLPHHILHSTLLPLVHLVHT